MDLGSAPERLREVLARDPAVQWAYLFGSAARGEPFRDLDVGVVLDPTQAPGAVRFGMLIAELERCVADVPLDVVDLAGATPAFRAAVVREGILLIDRDPPSRKAWELQAVRVWLDLQPWLARGRALRLEALRQREG